MLLRRLVEVVAEPVSPQQRLDRIVELIAANLVAEVCSVYFNRAGEMLELFATIGLAAEAVHRTRMRVGEGLVGTIAAQGKVINTADAQSHPNFRYFPETREEIYHSFLGVPILRAGRVVGVLTVQNRARRAYAEDEIEAMQVIASILAEMFASGELIDQSKYADVTADAAVMRRLDGTRLVEGVAIGQRLAARAAGRGHPPARREPAGRAGAPGAGDRRAARDARPDAGDQRPRSAASSARCSRPTGCSRRTRGWLRRIREAIGTGLSAEAAVRRVQEETRVRIGHASDPYLRERLIDLDDIANRLLRHLVGKALQPRSGAACRTTRSWSPATSAPPTCSSTTAASCAAWCWRRARRPRTSPSSPARSASRWSGRIEGAMAAVDPGNPVALDGDNGHVYVRPNDEILQRVPQRGARPRRAPPLLRRRSATLPSVTQRRHPDHACRSTPRS